MGLTPVPVAQGHSPVRTPVFSIQELTGKDHS